MTSKIGRVEIGGAVLNRSARSGSENHPPRLRESERGRSFSGIPQNDSLSLENGLG